MVHIVHNDQIKSISALANTVLDNNVTNFFDKYLEWRSILNRCEGIVYHKHI